VNLLQFQATIATYDEPEIQQLSPTQRIVLEMFYLENMKLHEISKVLDVPAGTIKSRLFHARENLKKIMTSQEE
jgi:RNA polymerase sigma factor (sigma-70 family)